MLVVIVDASEDSNSSRQYRLQRTRFTFQAGLITDRSLNILNKPAPGRKDDGRGGGVHLRSWLIRQHILSRRGCQFFKVTLLPGLPVVQLHPPSGRVEPKRGEGRALNNPSFLHNVTGDSPPRSFLAALPERVRIYPSPSLREGRA